MSHAKKFNYQDNLDAIKIFDRAIKKDSNYAPVLAGKSFAINDVWLYGLQLFQVLKQSDNLILCVLNPLHWIQIYP